MHIHCYVFTTSHLPQQMTSDDNNLQNGVYFEERVTHCLPKVRVGWNHTSAVVCITAYFQSQEQYMVCCNEVCVLLRLAGMIDGRQ